MTQPPANDKPLPNVKPDYPYKTRDTLIGFFGWLAINIPCSFWWVLSTYTFVGSRTSIGPLVFVPMVINVGALILLGFTHRWVAFGMLIALSLFLLIPLLLGGITAAQACFQYLVPIGLQ